jgi:hypothetical protein
MRIAIIGGGWYGCHIGLTLKKLGYDISLFEARDKLFTAASGNNQFRLHKGFHYVRHYPTRVQSRDGFQRFIERYPTLSAAVDNNLYAVASGKSLVDFMTYKIVMMASGIEFNEVKSQFLINVDGVLRTDERVIKTAAAVEYFGERLQDEIRFNTPVTHMSVRNEDVTVNGEVFDYAVDCTWGKMDIATGYAGFVNYTPCFYEPTYLIYYRASQKFPAITMVDGPLCSIYPTEIPDIYTLSSVTHTPLDQFRTPELAIDKVKNVSVDVLMSKRSAMEEEISRYIPNFRCIFKYEGDQLGIKTKPFGAYDNRSCSVSKTGRLFMVMSGKIDTIFYAANEIIGHLGAA